MYGYYCHKIPLALARVIVCACVCFSGKHVSERIFEEPLKSRTFWSRKCNFIVYDTNIYLWVRAAEVNIFGIVVTIVRFIS